MIDDYFKIPAVSNSKLTELKYSLNGISFGSSAALYFGSLFDAFITEPHRINPYTRQLDGIDIDYKLYDIAEKMRNELFKSDVVKSIFKNADFQKVSIIKREFDWNGLKFELDCKCKWDFFGPISGDIKTTYATTQKQFEAACTYLDYYRSRAWYMDIDNTDKDLIIGISKKNYKIFYVPIKRNDNNYNTGKQQYLDLVFKYWVLMT